jgi:glycosyltransferase involved in cell wall biosynthesis
VRLLIVTHRYPPDGVTGVERIAEWTASGLRDVGDEVTVLTRRPSTAPSVISVEYSQRDGVDVLSLVGGRADHASYPGHTSEVEVLFERVLVDVAPDAVLATHLLWHSPGYVTIASRLGIPTVVELHDFFGLCPLVNLQKTTGAPCAGPDRGEECARTCFAGQEGAPFRWTARWRSYQDALRSAAALVAPSRYMADTFGAYAAPGAVVHVVANPVAIPVESVAGPRRSGLLRLALIGGAVVPHKGGELLLDALRTARCGPVQLDVIGAMDLAYAKVVRQRASRMPNLRLRLSGAFDNHLLPALLRNVDAVVIPSTVAESFSIVAREAFACGLPVVAADGGALPEAVRDGHNGLLFRMGSAASLAVCLERLAHDEGLIDRLASGARSTRVATVEERVAAVRRVVEGALGAGPPPIPERDPPVVAAETPGG